MRPIEADWPGIAALVASGVTLQTISDQTGIALSTLKARCRRGGWKRAVKDAQTARVDAAIDAQQMKTVATNAVQVMANNLADEGKETRAQLSRSLFKGAKHAAGLDGSDVLENSRKLNELTRAASTVHGWGGERDGAGASIAILIQT